MKRSDLEHIIRAASAVTNEYELVIIGSQSILASFPNPPELIGLSPEADVYPLHRPEGADEIDGSMGEGSKFHQTNGYYAHGVGPETATLPNGWRDRLIKLQNDATDLKVGLCLDPTDLAASKLAAFRSKDTAFVKEMLAHSFTDTKTLAARIKSLPIDENRQMFLLAWLNNYENSIRPKNSEPGSDLDL